MSEKKNNLAEHITFNFFLQLFKISTYLRFSQTRLKLYLAWFYFFCSSLRSSNIVKLVLLLEKIVRDSFFCAKFFKRKKGKERLIGKRTAIFPENLNLCCFSQFQKFQSIVISPTKSHKNLAFSVKIGVLWEG